MGRRHHGSARRLRARPCQVAAFRSAVGSERPHRARDPPCRSMGAPPTGARTRGGDRAFAKPHAGAFFEVPATDPATPRGTVLLYGHLDKQPEMVGWREGSGPWEPSI